MCHLPDKLVDGERRLQVLRSYLLLLKYDEGT